MPLMKKSYPVLLAILGLVLGCSVIVFDVPIAQAATTVQVSAWGAGAGGKNPSGAGGGGGGAYAGLNAFSITSLQAYTVIVGQGGAINIIGSTVGTTTFSATSTLAAAPGWGPRSGVGGPGGSIASSTGDVLHAGGNGGLGSSGSGGGGGGAAGTTADGGIGGTGTVACSDGTAGTGGATGGGNGGKGGGATAAVAGVAPGGGGGGGATALNCSAFVSQAGAAGKIIITATLGLMTATGGVHTTDATNDYWTFTSNGVWTPTITPIVIPSHATATIAGKTVVVLNNGTWIIN